jgi:osmotically inducible protein OsmC
MSITTTSHAIWQGGLKDGKGAISTESGVLNNQPYGFNQRFEGESGTNPEELIGAAHAGCFSMALSKILTEHGIEDIQSIETQADVTLEQVDGGFAITKVHLTLNANLPGADENAFKTAANAAKDGCPVSKLLNAEITLDANLEN